MPGLGLWRRMRGSVSEKVVVASGAAVMAGLYLYLGGVDRSEVLTWQLALALLAVLYVGLLWGKSWSWGEVLVVGVALRACVFLGGVMLSDDVYRFIWDGLLWHEGGDAMRQSPQSYPIESLSEAQLLLREKMNSASYLSPYPLVHQLVFYLSTIGYTGVEEAIVRMRVLLFLADLGAAYALLACCRQRGLPGGLVGWYFLHPMAILEGVGNLHFEPYVLLFLLGCVWLMGLRQWGGAGLSLALAVGTKLLPLILFPYLLWRVRKQGGIGPAFCFGIACVAGLVGLFLPLWHKDLLKLFLSVTLYWSTFEFNAGLYFLLRSLGEAVVGYNPIRWLGPLLAALSALGIWMASRRMASSYRVSVAEGISVCLAIYLVLSTTVHPWYLLPLMGLGVLTRSRGALVWGYLALWSYVGYQRGGDYEHPYVWIAAEYGILCLWLFIEWKGTFVLQWLRTWKVNEDR